MEDKDLIKQQPGPQQGNIHIDSDEGKNDDGRAGSTLEKTEGPLVDEDSKERRNENELDTKGTP